MVSLTDARRVQSVGRAASALASLPRVRAVALAVLVLLVVPCAPPGGRPIPAPVGFEGAPARLAGGPAKPVGWRWPVDGVPQVVRPFDAPANPFGPGHRGVDLAAGPGVTVRSAGAGVVWFAGQVAGRGVVSVRHPDGRRTTYEPLHVSVRTGAAVRAGTPLGQLAIGHPGCPTPACLHWGLLAGETYQDPLSLLRPDRVRLYPF